ncbi:MAG: DUF3808 domain-containing protein [Candidatus Kapabacteria bacterium]|nr:DUF3808 domain-containing protein [Candidatus Kapabacteria bacterium]
MPKTKYLSAFVALLVLSGTALFAQQQQPDWAKVHTVTMSSIESLYNLQFEEAEAKANEVIKLAPQDPRGYFFRTMTYYYRFLYSRVSRLSKNEQDAEMQKFLGYAQQTITICEKFLQQNPNDSKSLFYIGGLHGYRGITLGFNATKTGDYLTAARDAQKGVDYLKQSLALDPNNADANMGLGLFNYIVSQVPSFAQSVIKLAGMTGNRVEGLKQLEYAAANGVYARAEAKSWLAQIYSRGVLFTGGEGMFDRAEQHYNSFLTMYPGNTLIRYFYGNMLYDDLRRPQDAIKQFSAASDDKGRKVEFLAAASCNSLGRIQMALGNLTQAATVFQQGIAQRSDIQALHANWGLCQELLGNRAAAVEGYTKAKDIEVAQKRVKSPVSDKEQQLIKAEWAFDCGDDTKAFTLINECLKRTDLTSAERANMHYLGGRSLASKSDYKLAEAYYAQALPLAGEEAQLKASIYYYLAIAQVKNGKKPEAVGSLEQAQSFKEYPGERRLRRNIERELYRLKRS